jgi:predicted RNA polymerase sigma factor
MAQRISRAKATIRAAGEPFALPDPEQLPARLANVLHVLYLVFTEGHTATEGTNLDRPDLACEAIRITGLLHDTRPDHPEVAGLLALMLLSDARRPARTDAHGRLVPLDQQDRTRWDHDKIRAGTTLITGALQRHQPGPYQLQAAIAAIHDRATSYAETDWEEILAVYDVLARLTPSPSITLNHAIATAMAHGPRRGLALLDEAADAIGDHHRYHATLAHLHELAGDHRAALSSYERAIALATNQPERDHLRTRAALLCAAGSPATTR